MILRDYAQRMIGGEATLNNNQMVAADVDSSGNVDSIDATMILKYYSLTLIGQPGKFY